MKKLIIETFIKGVVFSLGIVFTILGVYGVNSLVNIKSVDTTTVLTSNLWNETMSSLTGAINTLGNEVVKLTGNQTISGKKTFLTQVAGVTPLDGTDLATKDYVDTTVQAYSAGGTSWVTINTVCGGLSDCTPPLCPNGYTELYLSDKFYVSYASTDSSFTRGNVYNKYRTCAKKM